MRASHILLKGEDDFDRTLALMQELGERVQQEPEQLSSIFADLARRNSECPSATQGGDLGFFERGWMTPEFEAAAFAMQAGELSEPVRSPFGFHIIKVEEKRGGDLQSFEEVRPQLEADFRAEEAERDARRRGGR